MSTSINGWSGITSGSSTLLGTYTIPGTAIKIKVRKSVAPVLVSFLAEWNRLVMPLDKNTWGWNYRVVAGSTSLSNHASGTAVDADTGKLPQYGHNLTASQLAAVNKLITKYKVLTNGSQWSAAYRDEMHTEISNGVTQAQVDAVIAEYHLDTVHVPGVTPPKPKPPVPPIIIGDDEVTKGYVFFKKSGHVNAGYTVEVIDGVAVLRWIQNSQALKNLELAGVKPLTLSAADLALFPTVGTLPPVG